MQFSKVYFSILLILILFIGACANRKETPKEKSQQRQIIPESDSEIVEERKMPQLELDTASMDKVEKLKWLYEKTVSSNKTERPKYELLFFKAYPSSFKELKSLYGYDDENGAMPLYHEYKHPQLFATLKSIPKETYYNKLLDTSVNGRWEADNIQDFAVLSYLKTDTEDFCEVMSKRSDKEIVSIFRYIFDGPHPDNYQDDVEELNSKIEPINNNMALLMRQAFNELLEDHDGHGH